MATTRIGRLAVELGADSAKFERDMARARQSTRRSSRDMRRAIDRISKSQANLSRGLTQLVGAFALVAGARGIGQMVRESIAAGAAIQDTSDKLGIAVTALQEYRFAAVQVGVEQNALDMGLQRFTRRIAEAQAGTGELLPIIEQYGIALRDANGQTRSAETILLDLADATEGAGSAQEQLRIAFKAFDSEGAALVNLLRRGRDGFEEFAREARAAGVIIDREVIEKAKRLDGQLATADASMSAAETTILTRLGPGLVKLSGWLSDAADEAVDLAKWLNLIASRLGALPLDETEELTIAIEALGGSTRALRDLTEIVDVTPGDPEMVALLNEQLDKTHAKIQAVRQAAAAANAGRFTPRDTGDAGGDGGGGGADDDNDEREKAVEDYRKFQRRLTDAADEARGMRFAIVQRERFDMLDQIQDALEAGIISEREAAADRIKVEQVTQEKLDEIREQALADQVERIKKQLDWEVQLQRAREKQEERYQQRLEETEAAARRVTETLVDGFEAAAVEGRNLGQVLAKIAAELLRMELRDPGTLENSISGFASLFSNLLGGGGGFTVGGVASGATPPRFASGGSFTVGGAGGVDRNLVQFMATRGERVTVETPNQQGQGGDGGVHFTINAQGADREGLMAVVRELRILRAEALDTHKTAQRAAEGFRRTPALRGARG